MPGGPPLAAPPAAPLHSGRSTPCSVPPLFNSVPRTSSCTCSDSVNLPACVCGAPVCVSGVLGGLGAPAVVGRHAYAHMAGGRDLGGSALPCRRGGRPARAAVAAALVRVITTLSPRLGRPTAPQGPAPGSASSRHLHRMFASQVCLSVSVFRFACHNQHQIFTYMDVRVQVPQPIPSSRASSRGPRRPL
jgi:hypothetical protein